MTKVLMLVEGQTEETFVNDVLGPHLRARGIYLTPILLTSRIVRNGPNFRGGIQSYRKVRREIQNLLGDTSAAGVTTMFDLYALPSDFPGYDTRPTGDCYASVAHLERACQQDIAHPRFQPYLQLHEFEALIFTAPEKISAWFANGEKLVALRTILAAVDSPEEIDEGDATAPSKRLVKIYPAYQKVLHGSLIALDIGLARMRSACPHFDQWVRWLESLKAK